MAEVVGVAAVLITSVLAGLIAFANYQLAVVAAPGYDMYWPTQPAGARPAITKSYQRFIETRTCEHTSLVGVPKARSIIKRRARTAIRRPGPTLPAPITSPRL